MTVTWENYLWSEPIQAPDEVIDAVERAWGIRFPDDYLAVARFHQGQSPVPNIFRVGRGNDVFNCLLHFMQDAPHAGYSLLNTYENLSDWLPPRVYPFAETPGGNIICFDYRTSATAPSVVHADHEYEPNNAITSLAPSFTAFLDTLYDDLAE